METSTAESSNRAETAEPLDHAEQVIDPRLLALVDDEGSHAGLEPVKKRAKRGVAKDGKYKWERKAIHKQHTLTRRTNILGKFAAEDYRPLLNSEIEEVAGIDLLQLPGRDEVVLQLGASQWTRLEYETFFRALLKKGKNAIKDIATTVGTKSEVETQVLLLHFQTASQQSRHGLRDYGFHDLRVRFMTDIPAAIEVSKECCDALEGAADHLAWMWEKNEIVTEKLRYGDNWLLDQKLAAKLKRACEREEDERQQRNPEPDSEEDDSDPMFDDDTGHRTDEASELEIDLAHHEGDMFIDDGGQDESGQGEGGQEESGPDEDNQDRGSQYEGGGDEGGQDGAAQDEGGGDDAAQNEAVQNNAVRDEGVQIPASVEANTVADQKAFLPMQQSKAEEDDERATLEHWPAARLLNAPNWVELSDELFMRQVPLDKPYKLGYAPDWQSLALRGQEPSIYHTAFSDFHDLAINVTRRLVQVSINQALSRLRAHDYRDARNYMPTAKAPKIRRVDAQAAIDLLGMPRNSNLVLAGAGKKCGLLVRYEPKGTVNLSSLERSMGTSSYRKDYRAAREIAAAEQSDDPEEDWFSTGVDSEEDKNQQTEDPGESSANDTGSRKRKRKQKGQSDEQDADIDNGLDPWTEAYDQAQDTREELRLWKILKRDPPPSIRDRDTEFSRPDDTPSTSQRVDGDGVYNWRDWTDYRAEWETYGNYDVTRKYFMATGLRMKNRRARRAQRMKEVLDARTAEEPQPVKQHNRRRVGRPSNAAREAEQQANLGSHAEEDHAEEDHADEDRADEGHADEDHAGEDNADEGTDGDDGASQQLELERFYAGLREDPNEMFDDDAMFLNHENASEDEVSFAYPAQHH